VLKSAEGDIETQITIAAHHEAGHATVAAVRRILLRPEGIMVGQDAQGLACYRKEPDRTDASVEAHILASFAGFYAENHFRKMRGHQPRDYEILRQSLDWQEARSIEGLLSDTYLAGRSVSTVHKALEERAEQLVAQNWPVIERVAQALLDKRWEPRKPLRSNFQWSGSGMAKYVIGEEIVEILVDSGITADCLPGD